MFPESITLSSGKPIHWVCRRCSLGILHKWVAKSSARTHNQRGCPYCSGHAVCKCNSLATCCPELAQEWNYSKNEAGPDEYTVGSGALVWWQTASRGSWQACISQRMQSRSRQQLRNARKLVAQELECLFIKLAHIISAFVHMPHRLSVVSKYL